MINPSTLFYRRLPGKIVLVGHHYTESKKLSLPELALAVESDLLRLAANYPELCCHFQVKLEREQGELQITLIGPEIDTLPILESDIEAIVDAYNKQILLQKNGRFLPRYCRFTYSIGFEHRKLSVLQGGLL